MILTMQKQQTARQTVFTQTFSAFLKDNLTSDEYKYPVFTKLGWTKTRLTRFENRPESMRHRDVMDLAHFFWGDRTKAFELVERYNCGIERITMAEKQVIETMKQNHLNRAAC
jgi:hypothetical protein